MFVDHLYSSGFTGTGSGPVVVGQAPPPCDPELGKWKRWMHGWKYQMYQVFLMYVVGGKNSSLCSKRLLSHAG